MKAFDLPGGEKLIYEKMNSFIVIGGFDGVSHDNFFKRVLELEHRIANTGSLAVNF